MPCTSGRCTLWSGQPDLRHPDPGLMSLKSSCCAGSLAAMQEAAGVQEKLVELADAMHGWTLDRRTCDCKAISATCMMCGLTGGPCRSSGRAGEAGRADRCHAPLDAVHCGQDNLTCGTRILG